MLWIYLQHTIFYGWVLFYMYVFNFKLFGLFWCILMFQLFEHSKISFVVVWKIFSIKPLIFGTIFNLKALSPFIVFEWQFRTFYQLIIKTNFRMSCSKPLCLAFLQQLYEVGVHSCLPERNWSQKDHCFIKKYRIKKDFLKKNIEYSLGSYSKYPKVWPLAETLQLFAPVSRGVSHISTSRSMFS